MRRHSRKLPSFFIRRAVLGGLAFFWLMTGTGTGEPAPGDHRMHDAHSMTMNSEGEAGTHHHPEPSEQAQPGVGLSEKLGGRIPLDLTFTDEQGRHVQLGELISAPTIIVPVYYHCPSVCSFLQAGLARSLPGIRLRPGEDFNVLSISFDPTETPELARSSEKTYMAAMQGAYPEEAWHFLTGEQDSISQLLDAAGYRVQPRGEDWLHPVAVFVVSKEGKIVRYLHGTSFLPKDLTLALMEAEAGIVGPTIRKMVTFCFSYDPENKTYVFNLLRVSAVVVLTTAGAFLAFLLFTGRKRASRRENR